MSKTTTVTGDVLTVDHVSASQAGNPTYRVTLTDGQSFLTATDYGIAAGNYRPHSLRLPVSSVVLTLNGRGRIVAIKRPGGFRDGDQFTAHCGHTVTVPKVGGTGYARHPETGETWCYSCSDEMERAAFLASPDRFVAYVDSKGDKLTTWPGGHLAMNTGHTESRNNFGGRIHRWWFQDREGGRWYGQNGGPGEVIQVRRIKG